MVLKVLNKVNSKLKFLYRQSEHLNPRQEFEIYCMTMRFWESLIYLPIYLWFFHPKEREYFPTMENTEMWKKERTNFFLILSFFSHFCIFHCRKVFSFFWMKKSKIDWQIYKAFSKLHSHAIYLKLSL